jgi:hypothetical protein
MEYAMPRPVRADKPVRSEQPTLFVFHGGPVVTQVKLFRGSGGKRCLSQGLNQ